MTFADNSMPPVSNTTNIPLPSYLNQHSVIEGNSTRHGIGRGSQIYRPSWQTSDKRPRFFAIRVTVSNIDFMNQKPMHITINNSLPSVNYLLGLLADNEIK